MDPLELASWYWMEAVLRHAQVPVKSFDWRGRISNRHGGTCGEYGDSTRDSCSLGNCCGYVCIASQRCGVRVMASIAK